MTPIEALKKIAELTDPLNIGCMPPKAVEEIHETATAAIEEHSGPRFKPGSRRVLSHPDETGIWAVYGGVSSFKSHQYNCLTVRVTSLKTGQYESDYRAFGAEGESYDRDFFLAFHGVYGPLAKGEIAPKTLLEAERIASSHATGWQTWST